VLLRPASSGFVATMTLTAYLFTHTVAIPGEALFGDPFG
jgi:hypothetical protein